MSGLKHCLKRVLRGGSWNNNTNNMRSANRNRNSPSNRNNNNGFRLAQSALDSQSGIAYVVIPEHSSVSMILTPCANGSRLQNSKQGSLYPLFNKGLHQYQQIGVML